MSTAKKTGNIVVWGILLLLIVGLSGFGVTNFGGSVQSIGKVGDTDISIDAYARELTAEIRAAEAATGTRIALAEAEATGLTARARGQVITFATLDDELARLGISVGDAQVRDQVLSYDAFNDAQGNFDRDAYAFTLRQNGLSEAEFEAQIRAETARTLLQGALLAGVPEATGFGDILYGYLGARRGYSFIALSADDLDAQPGTPDDATLAAYHQDNAARYTAPESRAITYAWLTPDMLIDSVEVDEDSIRAIYDERIDEFQQPERRLVERLVYPTAAEADAAYARLEAGEASFDDLVAERGLALSDVDMGDVTASELGRAGDAVFGLDDNGVVGPVDSDLGPAIFRVNAILAAQNTSFEEARQMLREDLARERAGRVIDDQITMLEDELAAGATLEDMARDTEMQLGQIDYVAGLDEGIAAYGAFRDAARAAQEGDFPEISELEDGGVFALRLDGVTPAALRPLDELRAQVLADWQADETRRLLSETAEALKDRLSAGEAIETFGYEAEAVDPVSRDGVAPVALAQAVFALPAEGDATVVAGAEGTVYLVQLDTILPPDAKDADATFLSQILSQQATQMIGQDLFAYFTQARLNAAGLTLDEAAIRAVHANLQ